ncbi:MAG: LamG domain-containing protein [Polyangia bacterium]
MTRYTLSDALHRGALLVALLAVGCANGGLDLGFSVALTARFGTDVDDARLASVTTLLLRTTGDETYSRTITLGRPAAREERLVYRPAPASRTVQVAIEALDAAAQRVATGTGTLTLLPGTTLRYEIILGATQPQGDYPAVVKADNPLAYYRLGERSGAIARDVSGNSIDAQYLGAVTLGVPGAVSGDDTAVSLDGGDSGITATDPRFDFTGNTPFSLEAWVAPGQTDGVYRNLFELEAYDASSRRQQYSLYLYGPHGVDFNRVVDDKNMYVSAPSPPLHVFTHLVAVYDGTSIAIYMNGALIDSAPDARPSPTKSTELRIGHGNSAEVAVLGAMDEVAIYDTALSAARVQAHFLGARAP